VLVQYARNSFSKQFSQEALDQKFETIAGKIGGLVLAFFVMGAFGSDFNTQFMTFKLDSTAKDIVADVIKFQQSIGCIAFALSFICVCLTATKFIELSAEDHRD